MSQFSSLGLDKPFLPANSGSSIAMLTSRQVLRRLLRFTGYTIHDVVNDPIARNAVLVYYRLYRQIENRCERGPQMNG